MRAVNLIPSEQRSGGTVGARSGGAVFFVPVLLGGMAILALLYGSAHHALKGRKAEAANLSAQAQQVQSQAAQLAPYASFMSLREQRLHAIAQLVGARFDWPTVMGELSRVLPGQVALSSLIGSIGTSAASGSSSSSTSPAPAAGAAAASTASAVSSATPPGVTPTLTLQGCAKSQSVVAQTLVRLRLVSGVKDVELSSSAKTGSGGGTGSNGCPSDAPVFTVQVTFEPLPSAATPSIQALTGARQTAAATTTGGAR
jgi:Tfp pilus assembly protein PilN